MIPCSKASALLLCGGKRGDQDDASDSRRMFKGLQPLIKHLPICLRRCCVQLRRDPVARLICRPAALRQHNRGGHWVGMAAAELPVMQPKMSPPPPLVLRRPVLHCSAAWPPRPLWEIKWTKMDGFLHDGLFMIRESSGVTTAGPSEMLRKTLVLLGGIDRTQQLVLGRLQFNWWDSKVTFFFLNGSSHDRSVWVLQHVTAH